jgi:hypothetical protein
VGYVCQYDQLPLYKWFSDRDVTGQLPGLMCTPLAGKPPGTSWREHAGWWKIMQLVEGFPWE